MIDVVHGAEASFELSLEQPPCPHWQNYPATVVRRIVRNFPPPLLGVDIAIASDLPRASGMDQNLDEPLRRRARRRLEGGGEEDGPDRRDHRTLP